MYDHFMFDIVNFVCTWRRILIYFILILVILFRVTGIIRVGQILSILKENTDPFFLVIVS